MVSAGKSQTRSTAKAPKRLARQDQRSGACKALNSWLQKGDVFLHVPNIMEESGILYISPPTIYSV
jgi:hypothetical protein